ncbi:MAG TPA: HAD-IA family hydrolase [Actinomycetota bacterium]|nr:HAD-IA family hydrolase [Actinomycetota bacterium]
MRLRAVFFDVGETLVHVDPSFAELFVHVLAREGHDRTLDEVREASAHVYAGFSDAARDRSMWTTSPERSRAFWTSVYERMLEDLGLADGDGLAPTLYREFTRLENYALFDDVRPALAALEAAGLRLGIVSNFEAWLEEWFGVHELLDTFPIRVISGIEGIEKPDERIYRLALERAGVAATDAAYVGDNPEFDVDPPAALGMFAVLVDRRDRFPGHAGPRIRDLRDLPSVLEAA